MKKWKNNNSICHFTSKYVFFFWNFFNKHHSMMYWLVFILETAKLISYVWSPVAQLCQTLKFSVLLMYRAKGQAVTEGENKIEWIAATMLLETCVCIEGKTCKNFSILSNYWLSSALDEKLLRNTSAVFCETTNLFICCIQVIAIKPLKMIDL